MSQETTSSRNTTLLAFFAGAAIGAVVVALTTPKKGSELREDLVKLGNRVNGKIGEYAHQSSAAWQDVKTGAAMAREDMKQGFSAAARDLRG